MKRSRNASSSRNSASYRGRIAGTKFSTLHPWASYGAARLQRGTPDNVAYFGPTARSATAAQRMHRKATGFTGRGAYTFGDFLGDGEGYANRFLDAGVPKLLKAGQQVFNFSKQFLGRGAYTQTSSQHNSLITNGNQHHGPRQMASHSDETGDVTMSHCELIADVISGGSSSFTNLFNLPINPGLPNVFPWASQIAQNFDEYELKSLVYEFRSMIPDGYSAAGGTVSMCTEYNPTNPPFISKAQMGNYQGYVDGKITEHIFHGVECDPKKRSGPASEYVRTGPVPTGQDQKTYDLGTFYLATTGVPANTLLGELYCHYTITLKKGKLLSNTSTTPQNALLAATGGSAATPFGVTNNPQYATSGLIGINIGSSTVNFPASLPLETFYKITVVSNGATIGPVLAAWKSRQNQFVINQGFIIPFQNGGDHSTVQTINTPVDPLQTNGTSSFVCYVRNTTNGSSALGALSINFGTFASWCSVLTSSTTCVYVDKVDNSLFNFRSNAITVSQPVVDQVYWLANNQVN